MLFGEGSKLRELDLSSCNNKSLQGTDLTPFRQLEVLNLSHYDWISHLSVLFGEGSNLRELDLSSCNGPGVKHTDLTPFRQLEVLNLYACHWFTRVDVLFGAGSNLRELDISWAKHRALKRLDPTPLRQLEVLKVRNWSLVHPEVLVGVGSNLRVLDLTYCIWSTIDLARFRQLEELIVNGCYKLRGVDELLGEGSNLVRFEAYDCPTLVLSQETRALVKRRGIEIMPLFSLYWTKTPAFAVGRPHTSFKRRDGS